MYVLWDPDFLLRVVGWGLIPVEILSRSLSVSRDGLWRAVRCSQKSKCLNPNDPIELTAFCNSKMTFSDSALVVGFWGKDEFDSQLTQLLPSSEQKGLMEDKVNPPSHPWPSKITLVRLLFCLKWLNDTQLNVRLASPGNRPALQNPFKYLGSGTWTQCHQSLEGHCSARSTWAQRWSEGCKCVS